MSKKTAPKKPAAKAPAKKRVGKKIAEPVMPVVVTPEPEPVVMPEPIAPEPVAEPVPEPEPEPVAAVPEPPGMKAPALPRVVEPPDEPESLPPMAVSILCDVNDVEQCEYEHNSRYRPREMVVNGVRYEHSGDAPDGRWRYRQVS